MNSLKFKCYKCGGEGEEDYFESKLLTMVYRPKYQNFQAFVQIVCLNCREVVTIILELILEKPKKKEGK